MKNSDPISPTTVTEAMFCEIVQPATQALFADVLPAGYIIYKLAEYDPQVHTAPNLWFEKRENPSAKYLAILISDTSSVPALGETVTDAISAAIAKVEKLEGSVKQ